MLASIYFVEEHYNLPSCDLQYFFLKSYLRSLTTRSPKFTDPPEESVISRDLKTLEIFSRNI